MDDVITLDEQFVTALRRIVRQEVMDCISNEGLSEYELDDKIYEQAQTACESLLNDNLDDRISEYIDANISEMLDGKIKVIVE